MHAGGAYSGGDNADAARLAPPGWRRSVPNALTCARVVMAAALIALLAVYDASPSPAGVEALPIWAAVLFIVAAATDALDGWLARRWRVVSAFGRVMDPFADKLLVLGAFVMLAGPAFSPGGAGGAGGPLSGVEPWMAVVILGRELLVTSIRGVVEGAGGVFGATWSGKIKMILQSVAAPAILVLVATRAEWPWGVGRDGAAAWIAWATTIVTVWSGVPYVMRAAAALRAMPAEGT